MDAHTLLFIKAPKWKQSKCPSVVEWIHMCSFFFKDLWFICLFYFWPGGSSLLYLGFIQLQRMGATLYCTAQASHCSGLFVAQTLGCTGFSSVASRLQSTGSTVGCTGLVACGIFQDQGLNWCPLYCKAESQSPDHQRGPYTCVLKASLISGIIFT